MSPKKNIPEVIVALDVESKAEALELVDELKEKIRYFKLGSRIFTSEGPALVRKIDRSGCLVFLDLKFHDIPATVAGSVRAACRLGVKMLTIHTTGGMEMMKAAAREADRFRESGGRPPLLIGVTILTSMQTEDFELFSPGRKEMSELVLELALRAKEAGLDGVVSSAGEAGRVRKEFGEDFIIVTPGIRPSGHSEDDQKRVATPKSAAEAGSNFLVVGRPVYEASFPSQAVESILRELEE